MLEDHHQLLFQCSKHAATLSEIHLLSKKYNGISVIL